MVTQRTQSSSKPDEQTYSESLMDLVTGAILNQNPRRLTRALTDLRVEGDKLAVRIEIGEEYCKDHPEMKPTLDKLREEGVLILGFADMIERDYPEEVRLLFATGLFDLEAEGVKIT